MSEFSNVLQKIIKSSNQLTVYNIAKTLNCDRTWMQKVVTGDRNMNYETIIPLCSYLKKFVRSEVVAELYEIFAEEYFGDKGYRNVLYIKKRLQDMTLKESYIQKSVEKGTFDIEDFICEHGINGKLKTLVMEIFRLINTNKMQAGNQSEVPRLYVYFPADWTVVRDLFLFTLNDEICRIDMDFRCVFAGNGYENKKTKDKERIQIENFLSACEYAMYNLNVYDALNMNAVSFQTALLPYYIITDNEALLISEDGELYLKIEDKISIDKFTRHFMDLVSDSHLFLQKLNSYADASMILAEIADSNQIYMLGNHFLLDFFYTKEILEKSVDRQFNQREQIHFMLHSFYESMRNAQVHMMFSMDALLNFMEEKGNDQHISLEMKKQILDGMYEYCRQNKNQGIHIFDRQKYRFHSRFHMTLASDRLIQFINKKNDTGMENAVSFAFSPIMVRYLRDFYLYMTGCDVCLQKEAGMKAIEICMEMCGVRDNCDLLEFPCNEVCERAGLESLGAGM